jgi:hypothetical protein
LNEILEAKNPPKQEPEPFSYENDVTEEVAEVTPSFNQGYINEVLERSKVMAEERPLLTSTFDKDKTRIFNEHFKNYEMQSEKSTASTFAEEIKQHDGLRKAVIFSEILNRKHF